MNGEVEDFVSLYTECSKFPSPSSAVIVPSSTDDIIIQSKWAVRDIIRSETVNFSQNYFGKKYLNNIFTFTVIGLPVETGSETLCAYSPSRTSFAILRKILNKKNEEKQYIEIWNLDMKVKTIELQEIEVHGKVYDDNEFGCLEWSHSEDRILYIAERKKIKSKSFFKQRHTKEDIDTFKHETKMGMDFYSSEEDWGENLVSKHHPVICVMDITSGDVIVLDNIPDNISSGQAIWAPDDSGVVCVGWKEEPRRLGIVYCTNRRSSLYYIDLETAKCTLLGNDDGHIRSPRFSLDGKFLIYLENKAGGPHRTGSKLMKCDWKTKETSLIIDTVDKVEDFSSSQDSEKLGMQFTGIYARNLPRYCWMKDNIHIIFQTNWRSYEKIVCLNTSTGEIEVLTQDDEIGTCQVMDIWNDRVIICCSSPNQLPHIKFAELNANKAAIKWNKVDNRDVYLSDVSWSVVSLNPPNINKDYPDLDYEAIIIKPSVQSGPIPLIVFPHGGPHSAFCIEFQLYSLLFIRSGFAVLKVNYRGSIGFGENNILSLLGNIGSQDINDVQFAVETILERESINRNQLILFGGSHGGFIASHLSGQYPEFYKICICRNPVIDINGKLESTDIPDWGWIESGFNQFNFEIASNPDTMKIMWEKSPIRYVEKVKIPTLLLLGRNDRRVPPSQGLKYYHILKARNVPTRLIMYDDNHALAKVDVEADSYIQCMLWIKQHLCDNGTDE